MMGSSRAYIILVIAIIFSISSDLFGQMDTLRLRLKYTHQFQFAGYYAAIEQGFYKEQGIFLEIQEANTNESALEAVMTGKADFGIGNSELIIHYSNGIPIQAIASILQHSPSILISMDPNATVHQAIGKRIMILKGDSDAEIKLMLMNEGINNGDYTSIDHNFKLNELINGKVDFYHGYISNEPYTLKVLNKPFSIINPVSYGIDFYSDVIFASEDFCHNNTDLVNRFLQASLKGWNYAFNNQNEVALLIKKNYNTNKSLDHLLFEAKSLEDLALPHLVQVGHMNPERWDYIAHSYQKLQLINTIPNIDDFLFSTDYKASEYERLQQQLIYSVIIFLFIIIGINFFNYRLRKAVSKRTKELQATTENLQKLNEELELSKNKAQESDKLKSQFVANISHELRTPLNAIIGFSGLLVKEDEAETRERFFSYIEKSSKALMNLINDIMDISRIESKQMEFNFSDFSLEHFMLKMKEVYETNITDQDKSIAFIVDKENIPGGFIFTAKDRLQQIFDNLITNAIKFTETGHIRIGVHSCSKEEKSIQFYVQDTGIGLLKDQKDKIFERFTKITSDSSKLYRGAGLGLNITKYIVEQLGGKIWVDSTPGEGSTFHFTIRYQKPKPLSQQANGTKSAKEKLAVRFNKILIVEDEVNNYHVLHEFIKQLPFEIIWKKNGTEAVHFFEEGNEVDLVLMDINMPVMNGLEAHQKLKEMNITAPVIAQTAYAMEEDIQNIKDSQFTNYILKPIQQEKLIEMIKDLLEF